MCRLPNRNNQSTRSTANFHVLNNSRRQTNRRAEPVVLPGSILSEDVDAGASRRIGFGIEYKELRVIVAGESIARMRTPKFVQSKEDRIINGVVVMVHELANVVRQKVEVPRDPLYVNTDGSSEAASMDIKSHFL